MPDYLTEENLGPKLEEIFKVEFIHNKNFNGYRPDYRNDTLKLIVEFDGPRHFTESARIVKDYQNDLLSKKSHYRVVRIPYFVQLETRTIKHYFNQNYTLPQTFPHGFINDKIVLPADFCELGNYRYNDILCEKLPSEVSREVDKSLTDRAWPLNHHDLNLLKIFPFTTILQELEEDPIEYLVKATEHCLNIK
jgi:hypothetical protein